MIEEADILWVLSMEDHSWWMVGYECEAMDEKRKSWLYVLD